MKAIQVIEYKIKSLEEEKEKMLAEGHQMTFEHDTKIKMLNDKIKHYENILEELQEEYE